MYNLQYLEIHKNITQKSKANTNGGCFACEPLCYMYVTIMTNNKHSPAL